MPDLGHRFRLVRRRAQVVRVAVHRYNDLMEKIRREVRRDSFIARQERIQRRACDKAVTVTHHFGRVLAQGVVDRPALRYRAAIAVDVYADFVHVQILDLLLKAVRRYIAVKQRKRHDVPENVQVCRAVGLLDGIKLSILHSVHPLPMLLSVSPSR